MCANVRDLMLMYLRPPHQSTLRSATTILVVAVTAAAALTVAPCSLAASVTVDAERDGDAIDVHADYSGRISPGYPLLRVFEQSTVEHNVARQFQALADEIERQYRAAKK